MFGFVIVISIYFYDVSFDLSEKIYKIIKIVLNTFPNSFKFNKYSTTFFIF